MKNGQKITKTTADKFKPGYTYGYAFLKVHKLDLAQLRSKILPTVRFVSDLSRGLSSSSDKFLVWRWLADLTVDFATDFVKDSTEAPRTFMKFYRMAKLMTE